MKIKNRIRYFGDIYQPNYKRAIKPKIMINDTNYNNNDNNNNNNNDDSNNKINKLFQSCSPQISPT